MLACRLFPSLVFCLTMPLENCQLCRGTGYKLVPRPDGSGKFAVPCDCGMEDRANLVLRRAHIPKRYEHCDFESYVTDLADGKTWSTHHTQSLKLAKSYTETFTRDFPAGSDKGLLFMGPSGVGKTHLAVAAIKELIVRGHACLFCDYRRVCGPYEETRTQRKPPQRFEALRELRGMP